MSYVSAALRRTVYTKADGRCEYCLIHEDDGYMPHEVDHIYAEKHGGGTTEDNLCLSCVVCNRHKGSDIASLDPLTGEITPLFHPRKEQWTDHFLLNGGNIEPLTPQGRVTVKLLRLNSRERILERQLLMALDRYP